jgi:8-oxo-dGTP pyrophosphatase MutT (NUDIX family)
MPEKVANSEFIQHLHEEKLHTLNNRSKYVVQKLVFVTGLMGIGSLSLGDADAVFDFGYLLFLAPYVAVAFDLYILAEDYSVKRIGAFLLATSRSDLERRWEDWVSEHRDMFALLAMPILTTIVLLGSMAIVYVLEDFTQAFLFVKVNSAVFWIWSGLALVLSWSLFIYYLKLKRDVNKWSKTPQGQETNRLEAVAQAVRASDHVIDATTYAMITRLFEEYSKRTELAGEIEGSIKEYGQSEFLLCVDQDGEAVVVSEKVLQDFQQTVGLEPDYGLWFQETVLPNGQSTLLMARWLCHTVSIRHQSVHLFLDHPVLSGHLLLQVRGFDKAEAPGRFDLPVAGHVSALDAVESTLGLELEEEVGLELDEVDNLQELGSYNYADKHNAEYRTVYRGRLKQSDFLRLAGDKEEVAGLAMFSIDMVKQLLTAQPEHCASGLQASFPLYREA